MQGLVALFIQFVAGVIGGNAAGFIKPVNLGSTLNSIAGGIGGLLLGQLGTMLTSTGGSNLLEGLLGQATSGLIGGVGVTVIIGYIRNILTQNRA